MFTLPAQRALPNLVIGSPRDEQELRDMLVTALAHDGPISLHYPRDAGEDLPDRVGRALEIGKGEVLREGADLLLVGFGPIVQRLIRAADLLQASGVASTVVNARWAKPIDAGLLARLAAGKRLVVSAEESAPMGGFGDGVLDVLNQAEVHAPVLKVALSEGFVDHGSVDALRREQRIDTDGIVSRIREALGIDVAADESRAPTSTAA
jgi:1-deoxy-D-xylulose-5-phosphate synthase